jgi:bifunctional pyridoxal-dependent enzyme with beta-cystathionase and maltose regulon repressor activities
MNCLLKLAMTNHEKVYEDGKKFLRRLQRYLNNQTDLSDGQKTFKRITVAEPQGE